MVKKLIICLFLFQFLLAPRTFCGSTEYWVSFTSYNEVRDSAGPKYLMKIDVLGNVLMPPQNVVRESKGYASPTYGATALVHNGDFLVMWITDKDHDEDPPLPPLNDVFRAVIDKKTLRLISLRKTKLLVHNEGALQVSQRKKDNFLVLEKLDSDFTVRYVGIPLSKTAKILPGRLDLSSDPATCPCEMGISANGRIFFFLDKIGTGPGKFVLQRLTYAGHPVGEPVIVVSGRVTPADLSNSIAGNRRYALYNYPRLFLQVLSADTLEPIGDRIRIAAFTRIGNQTAAIDPLGRFVVYVTTGGHPIGSRLLMFQSLDALGHPSGQPKIIADRVQSGLDILKED